VRGDARHFAVSFTPEASPALISHAFQLNLRCFWGLTGCQSASQIASSLWQDKNAIEAAMHERLKSDDPCPDRILASRVKYFPDLEVYLLESMGFNGERLGKNELGDDEIWRRYKLIEVLRGRQLKPSEPANIIAKTLFPPYPGDYSRNLPREGELGAKAGERVLAFSNSEFDSCQVVPATASALSTVRNTKPAPRRAEDESVTGSM
jgi:hypothetical protein